MAVSFFHDEEDAPGEPIVGLPAPLPDGETIVWQGKPKAAAFAVDVFHPRLVAVYFALTVLWRAASSAAATGEASMGDAFAAAFIAAAAPAALAFAAYLGAAYFLGWLMARATVYTLTSRRLIIRHGVAIRKHINLPFTEIASAGLKRGDLGAGNVALTLGPNARAPYIHLWPHARPLRFFRAQPMLRAIPEPEAFAKVLAHTMKAAAPTSAVSRDFVDPVPTAPAAPQSKPASAPTTGAPVSGTPAAALS